MAAVIAVYDLGDDRLDIVGTVEGHLAPDGSPAELHAPGWRSALEVHYDPASYGDDGHRLPGAQPRPMTAEERLAYCRGRLLEHHPRASGPTDLGISG